MSRASGILRLKHLREQAEAVGERMAAQRGRFAALADPSSAPRVVASFNLFQSPESIASRMADALAGHYGPDKRILEPSAGLGRLYRATRAAGHAGPMVLVDISLDCCRELYGMIDGDNATLRQGDFLTMDLGRFDGAIMNPPFKQGRDIRHIRHALAMLNPGGRLVALCYNGPRQREQLRPLATSWVELEPGSFRSEGTGAAVVLAIFDK